MRHGWKFLHSIWIFCEKKLSKDKVMEDFQEKAPLRSLFWTLPKLGAPPAQIDLDTFFKVNKSRNWSASSALLSLSLLMSYGTVAPIWGNIRQWLAKSRKHPSMSVQYGFVCDMLAHLKSLNLRANWRWHLFYFATFSKREKVAQMACRGGG